MSRDIPQDQPLTEEDRKYLLDRGAWGQALITRIDENFPVEAPVALEEEADEETATGDSVGVDWTAYTKTELVAEIDRRNAEGGPQLDRVGTKQELVNRLDEDDARRAEA